MSTATNCPLSSLSDHRVQLCGFALVPLVMIVDLDVLKSQHPDRAHHPLRADIPPGVFGLNRFRVRKKSEIWFRCLLVLAAKEFRDDHRMSGQPKSALKRKKQVS